MPRAFRWKTPAKNVNNSNKVLAWPLTVRVSTKLCTHQLTFIPKGESAILPWFTLVTGTLTMKEVVCDKNTWSIWKISIFYNASRSFVFLNCGNNGYWGDQEIFSENTIWNLSSKLVQRVCGGGDFCTRVNPRACISNMQQEESREVQNCYKSKQAKNQDVDLQTAENDLVLFCSTIPGVEWQPIQKGQLARNQAIMRSIQPRLS